MSRADGARYEEQAAALLLGKGYRILERNFVAKVGELDLVAQDGETIVFVEVRQRTRLGFGSAAETIGPAKIRKIVRTAQLFAQARGLEERDMRFDVVAIDGGSMEHIEDAFPAF